MWEGRWQNSFWRTSIGSLRTESATLEIQRNVRGRTHDSQALFTCPISVFSKTLQYRPDVVTQFLDSRWRLYQTGVQPTFYKHRLCFLHWKNRNDFERTNCKISCSNNLRPMGSGDSKESRKRTRKWRLPLSFKYFSSYYYAWSEQKSSTVYASSHVSSFSETKGNVGYLQIYDDNSSKHGMFIRLMMYHKLFGADRLHLSFFTAF